MSDALERRHRLRDGDLEQALDRYRARLATARMASTSDQPWEFAP
jgi:hypothetical protein